MLYFKTELLVLGVFVTVTATACGTNSTVGCQSTCGPVGSTRCAGDGYQTCSDKNGDGCAEWGPTTACQSGATCQGGKCTSCTNECSKAGLTECSGTGAYKECGNFNNDSCLEWRLVTCPRGSTCSNGSCASSCTDDCTKDGQRACADNSSFHTCGHYDSDPCLDWSSTTSCGPNEVCKQGQCQPACANQCDHAGATRCSGDNVQTCGNYDTSNSCLSWGGDSPCKSGQTCSNGQCTASSNCVDECTTGQSQCTGAWPLAGYEDCGQNDTDSCTDWVPHSCVPFLEMCRDGACVPYCTDQCSPGEQQCAGDGYQTCGTNFDSTSCYSWSPVVNCGTNMTCSAGQCTPTSSCTDDCSTSGQRVCFGSNAYQTCGQFDSDPCLDLSSVTYCGPGQTCSNGFCVASCTDACTLGSYGCQDSSSYWDCYDQNGDGCTDKVVTSCGGGEVCQNGLCTSPSCVDDSLEPNDGTNTATPLGQGSYSNLEICPGNDDWFRESLAAGSVLDVNIYFTNANGDLDLEVYDASSNIVASSRSATDNESVSYTVPTSGDYFIRVFGYNGASNSYSISASITAPTTCVNDVYEPNNSLSAAYPIATGYTGGLQICAGDDDWYSIYLSAHDSLDVSIYFTNASGDLDMEFVDSSGTVLQSSTSVQDYESITEADAPADGFYYVHVYGVGASTENTYSMDIYLTAAPTCTDDSYEPDDTFSTAAELAPGYYGTTPYNGLQICPNNEDWYKIYLFTGESLTVTTSFSNAAGDLDLGLEDSAGNLISSSTSTSDYETVSVVNVPGSAYYYVRVYAYDPSTSNSYSLTLDLVAPQ